MPRCEDIVKIKEVSYSPTNNFCRRNNDYDYICPNGRTPDWPRQAWHQPAMDMTTKVHRLPLPPEEVWTGKRRLNPSWRLLLIEVNLLSDVHQFLPTQL
jgi:hypothetical protein